MYRPELSDFGAFYERSYQGAYRVALAIVRDPALAADVTQDAFVSAFRRQDQFRGDGPPAAWLHRIVANAAISAYRRGRPVVRELDVADGSGRQDPGGAADRMVLWAALDLLAPRHRAAVVLRYYHGYDYETIAGMLGTSSTNVGAMLSRALDRLRTLLEAPGTPKPAEEASGGH
jgi:RNA polymerase sigma-70 factor (ECF subfamily)